MNNETSYQKPRILEGDALVERILEPYEPRSAEQLRLDLIANVVGVEAVEPQAEVVYFVPEVGTLAKL